MVIPIKELWPVWMVIAFLVFVTVVFVWEQLFGRV
jgi:hypothetical protein